MLKLDNLNASIHGTPILHDINASFPYGTISVLLGPNGCGKSTLLQCLFLPRLIQSGTIYLDSMPLFSYSAKERAKRIAYLPQLYDVAPITVKQLVAQGRFPYTGKFGSPNFLDNTMISKAMQDANVSSLAERKITCLSGGEQRRAYLAMILAQNTDYIVLDEPTTFLDLHHRLEFLELLKTLRDRGKTIVIVLHDIDDALKIADIVFLIKQGRLMKTLSGKELLANHVVDEIFGVQMDYLIQENKALTNFHLNPKKHDDLSYYERVDADSLR